MSRSTVRSRIRHGSRIARACVTGTRLAAHTGKCSRSMWIRPAGHPARIPAHAGHARLGREPRIPSYSYVGHARTGRGPNTRRLPGGTL